MKKKKKERHGNHMESEPEEAENGCQTIVKWIQMDEPYLAQDGQIDNFLLTLMEHSECDITRSRTMEWIEKMKVFVGGQPWEEGQSAMATNSLSSIIQRCQRNAPVVYGVTWMNMINLIQLVVKTDR